MKVLLVNGSPKKKGCTYTALSEIQKSLQEENIETEIFHIGPKPISGCIACGKCHDGNGRCAIKTDAVNTLLEKCEQADAYIFGSPVYYASANGALTACLDRLFYAGNCFSHKPAAAIVSARRGGTTAAFDQLNKYFTISQMPIVSSQYWNMVHGHTPEDVLQDLEGLQIMRTLGKNMAWLLNCINTAAQHNITPPQPEPRIATNFIR